MRGSEARKSRAQFLHAIASSLMVSAQNGHSIRPTDVFCRASTFQVRRSPQSTPGEAGLACEAGRPARQQATLARRYHAHRKRKPSPRAHSRFGKMDKAWLAASGRNLQNETRRPHASFGILDIDLDHVFAGRELG